MTQAIAQPRPRQTAKFAKFYAGAWTLLAALALAYMVTLAVQPSVIGDWTPGRIETDTADTGRSAARFATDLTGLKQSIGEIQKDVSTLRTAVLATASRDKEIFERLSAVEERTKATVVAEAAAPKTMAQKQAELKAQKAAERAAAAAAKASQPAATTPIDAAIAVAAVDPAATTARVTVLNAPPVPAAPPTNPIATGSISPPAHGVPAPPPAATAAPVAFGPGAVTPAAHAAPVAVELATGPSLDALRLNWSLLAERHAGSLKNLEARYTNAGEGQPYQLVAGPINSTEEAAKVCAQLKAKKVACRVTGFGGNAL